MALIKKKLRELSIEEKIMVIQQTESEEKSQRKLAKILGVSKTQIQTFWLHMTTTYRMTRRGLESFQFEDFDSLTFR